TRVLAARQQVLANRLESWPSLAFSRRRRLELRRLPHEPNRVLVNHAVDLLGGPAAAAHFEGGVGPGFSNQSAVCHRAIDTVSEAKLVGPTAQVGEVEVFGLHFHHAEHVVPLPVGDAPAHPIPVELGDDGVLRSRNPDWRMGLITEGEELTTLHLAAMPGARF